MIKRKNGLAVLFFLFMAAMVVLWQSENKEKREPRTDNVTSNPSLSNTEGSLEAVASVKLPKAQPDADNPDAWNSFAERIQDKYPVTIEGRQYKFKPDAFPALNAQGAEDWTEWYKELGHFDESDFAQYAGYDEATLESLSEQGDIRAMQLLSEVYTSEGPEVNVPISVFKEKLNKSRRVLERAAVHGSTRAMLGLWSAYSSFDDDEIESSAWRKAAADLGDLNAQGMVASSELTNPKGKDELELIDARAKEILVELDEERARLNLGDRVEKPSHVVEYERQYAQANQMMRAINQEYQAVFGSDEEPAESVVNDG